MYEQNKKSNKEIAIIKKKPQKSLSGKIQYLN